LLENLLDTGGTLSVQTADAMLKCTNGLRNYVQGLRSSGNPPDHFSALAHELLQSTRAKQQQSPQANDERSLSKVPDEAGAESPPSASEDTPHNTSEDQS
jgi:hypothetical protein